MKRLLKHLVFFLLFFLSLSGTGQETFVHFNRNISFGTFYASEAAGGSICISNAGVIHPSQQIGLLTANAYPASISISTTSESPIDIQIEARAERLQSQEGNRLSLKLHDPDRTYYTIVRGRPAEIELGGCLEIVPGANASWGDYSGVISVDVIILNH